MSELGEGPGAALKSAREALNVSEREVADALNLPLSVIEAMEANDYEQLPPPVFTRGYLRSYARLLELDPDDIVASFPVAEEDNVASLTGEFAAVSAPNPLADRRIQIMAAAVVAVVLLVILVVMLSSSEDDPMEKATTTAAPVLEAPQGAEPAAALQQTDSAVIPRETSSADVVVPETSRTNLSAAQLIESEADEAIDADSEAGDFAPVAETGVADAQITNAPDVLAVSEEPTVEPETAELTTDPTPAGMRRITPFGDDVLTMTFTDDCWVDIKNRDGAQLYGDLIRGGRTIALIGDAPFRVLLGYAPGAQVSFNGEEVDVESRIRNNVARLTVGN